MKIKTSELADLPLDWAVAQCEKVSVKKFPESKSLFFGPGFDKYKPSTNPAQAWPIIEREKISIIEGSNGEWQAGKRPYRFYYGPAGLIAAMRCYVASKLGDEVDIPKELL